MVNAAAIGVVVLHYGADELTLRCLRSLLEDNVSPATEVVLVDNGPGTGFAERVRRELPAIEVVVPGTNLGFAAGCNLGVAALGPVDAVALVNSDMDVPAGWLMPLVEALAADDALGAACPKILFDGRFRTLELEAATTWRPGRGDNRQLAWHLGGVRLGGKDVTASCQLVEGFWEPDRRGTWVGPRAVLRVPAGAAHDELELFVEPPRGHAVLLHSSTGSELRPPSDGGWSAVRLDGEAVPVINNVGNAWRSDWYGIDLGFQEVDSGQHEQAGPVAAWCGGAVLLRRAYLEDTGGFDERLFLYYEDLELSLRGAARGWRYWYEPRSVVAHRHAASSMSQPRRTALLKERNRLLLLARHGGTWPLVRELVRFLAVTLSYLRRDVVAALLRGESPWWGTVGTRLAALGDALPLLPRMAMSRRRDRQTRTGMRAPA